MVACGVCGRAVPADWALPLRAAPAAEPVAHCPDCIDGWGRRFEARRQGRME